jgi:DNA-binding CsgD family transcriptional regulator
VLEPLGISPAAEEVYLAKLARPSVPVAELTALTGLHPAELDGAVAELVEHCLLRPESRPGPEHRPDGELHPVAPALALDALLARRRAEALRQQYEVELGQAALATIVAELEGRTGVAGGDPSEAQEITGHDAARQALERLAFESRHEILTFSPSTAAAAMASLSVTDPLTAYLVSKGVRVRMISVHSVRTNVATVPYVRRVVELGAQVRTVPTLPTAMVIVDRSRVMLPLDPQGTPAGVCICRSGPVRAVMSSLFLHYWQDARHWDEPSEPVPAEVAASPEPTDQERALLALLLDGSTDYQAGRQLGISTRTVGRMASTLMRRLGARSRFQAGALAVVRGWVTSVDRP